jgi:hypothetical protein
VITAEGQFTPGSKGRAHWGKARLPVCNALLDRAGRIVDAASLLRRPSVTGLQALSLYNQLMHMSDQGSRVKDQWIQIKFPGSCSNKKLIDRYVSSFDDH